MKRYFIDTINENRPTHIPDTQASYCYLGKQCFMEVTNPSAVFLGIGLTEVPADQIGSLTNNQFPTNLGNPPVGV